MTVLAVKQRYIQSLPKYLTLCEHNYLRALKLLPNERKQGSTRQVQLGNNQFAIKVDGCAKYTMDISISQLTGMLKGFNPLFLTVRLYHDAKVALKKEDYTGAISRLEAMETMYPFHDDAEKEQST